MCPPLMQVLGSSPSRVIPKTYHKNCINCLPACRAPRPPTFLTFPTKQVGTSYFEENSPTFPTFYQFYENVISI